MIGDLVRNRPPLIVLDPTLRVGGQDLERDAPRIMTWIRRHYRWANRSAWQPGDFQIWLAP
jgi:hypothetical protein